MSQLDDYAQRKALLVLKSDLERLRLSGAARQAQALLAPPAPTERAAWIRPLASTVLGLALPLAGPQRLILLVRSLSFALRAYRVVRNWRTPHPR